MVILEQIISSDIIREKYINGSHKSFIQESQKILSDLPKADEKTFVETGRIMSTKDFLTMYPTVHLDADTKNIVRYVGGFYVQMLSNGNYLYKYHEDTELAHIEKTMWNDFKKLRDEKRNI